MKQYMKRGLLLLCLLLGLISTSYAQQKHVTGVVLSAEDKQPVIGASVVVVGNTKIGVATNMEGTFKLEVPADAKSLKISYMGYEAQTVTIGNKPIKVYLTPSTDMLNEVVVAGYSTPTKRSFVGSASVVNAKEISNKAVSNVSQALAGEAPGVTVINSSGQPGTSADIYVRGIGSINGSTAPLYVVDGLPFDGDITSINPNDIKSITILKDAASTSIYGSRGANGVIVITTKEGQRGKMNVSVSQSFGVNMRLLPQYDVIRSPEDYISMIWQGLKQKGEDLHRINPALAPDPVLYADENLFVDDDMSSDGINHKYNLWDATAAELIDPVTGQVRSGVERIYSPENWRDYAFQNSFRSESNLSLSGGSNKAQYFGSVGFLKDKGYAKGSDFQRFTTRLNLNANPTTWMNVGLNLNYNASRTIALGQQSYTSTNMFTWVDEIPPIYPLFQRDANGALIPDPYNGGYVFDFGIARPYQAGSNGVAVPYLDQNETWYESTTLTGYLNFRFLKYFSFENRYQGTKDNARGYDQTNKYYGPDAVQKGGFYKRYSGSTNITGLNLLRFHQQYRQNDWEAFVAHEFSYMTGYADNISKQGIVDPSVHELGNTMRTLTPAMGGSNKLTLESYFSQLMYNYDNRYFGSATFRRDGSSRFVNHKWGNFYSLGAAWMISSEKFMQECRWVNELKLKASYGTLGSQGISEFYPGYDIYAMKANGNNPAFTFVGKGNPDLTWEKSSMFQVGVEFKLFNCLEGSLDVYRKTTTDMLYTRKVAPSNGYALFNVNDGKLLNAGVDFTLTGHLLKTKNAYLDLTLNGSYLKNEMLRMAIDPSTGQPIAIDESVSAFARTKGHSLYDHYGHHFMGVDPETGNELYKMTYVDKNGNNTFDKGVDEVIVSPIASLAKHPELAGQFKETSTTNGSLATREYLGKSSLPWMRGALNIKAGYHGLSLSVQLLYALGGYGYDNQYASYMDNMKPGSTNLHKDLYKRWTHPGQVTNIPKYNAGLSETDNGIMRTNSDRMLTSTSFLSLNNVKLNYDFNKVLVNRLGLTHLSVWISGDNIALISARKGYNPMTSISGTSYSSAYKPLTTFTAGLNLVF